MVMVDLYVPAFGRTYNFELDERTPVRELMSEIVEVICKKESCEAAPVSSYTLSGLDAGQVFMPEHDLSEYGIKNGSRLMLV